MPLLLQQNNRNRYLKQLVFQLEYITKFFIHYNEFKGQQFNGKLIWKINLKNGIVV